MNAASSTVRRRSVRRSVSRICTGVGPHLRRSRPSWDQRAAAVLHRRSASLRMPGTRSHRIATMPKRAKRQYRRNLARAGASVAAARVSVAKRVTAGSRASVSNVQAILTRSGSANEANRPAAIGVKTTSAFQGSQAAPATKNRPGSSARMPSPSTTWTRASAAAAELACDSPPSRWPGARRSLAPARSTACRTRAPPRGPARPGRGRSFRGARARRARKERIQDCGHGRALNGHGSEDLTTSHIRPRTGGAPARESAGMEGSMIKISRKVGVALFAAVSVLAFGCPGSDTLTGPRKARIPLEW